MAFTVTMPQLGETVTEGTILQWHKKPGDTIAEDEVLLEISTDKVDTEVPSPAAGTILEILVPEGETVAVGTALVTISDSGEGAAEATAEPPAEAPAEVPATEAAPEPAHEPEPAPEPAPVAAVAVAPAAAPVAVVAPAEDGMRSVLSPVVRKLAAEHSVDLSLVTGTGKGGRITRKDVKAFIDSGGAAAAPAAAPTPTAVAPAAQAPPAPVAAPAAPAAAPTDAPAGAFLLPGDEVVPLDRLRVRIANNMIRSKQTAAHVWTSVEVDFEAVERVRSGRKAEWKAAEGFSLTYLPFIARATIDALGAFPVVNSSFYLEDGKSIFHRQVNLGIAIDLNQRGLVVTPVKAADGLRLRGIAREVRRLAEKGRGGNLEPDDLSGATFTITNPGPFGSFMSAPIINVPNTGILSTDTVVKRPTVVTQADGTDAIAIHHIGYLGLTWDHRAFDGSTAVLFLRRIKESLETWDWEQELS